MVARARVGGGEVHSHCPPQGTARELLHVSEIVLAFLAPLRLLSYLLSQALERVNVNVIVSLWRN